ncbi:hypothetical protein [Flagellimonas sp.]|uniref:hypothetical protein n=1 Tax=Flagellimonas sp. TaxID=2058762 RepID=UPI003B593BF8
MSTFSYWKNFENGSFDLDISKLYTLPVCHNLRYKELEYLIGSSTMPLPKTNAPVFDTPLLFFYYGVPAYWRDNMFSPSIVLFEAEDTFFEKLRWSPTDSGALNILIKDSISEEFRSEYIDEETFKDEFILSGNPNKKNLEYLKQHLKLFFDTTESYLSGSFTIENLKGKSYNENVNVIKRLFQVKSSQHFVRNTLNFKGLDRRIKLIEGHSSSAIELGEIKPIFCYVPNNGKEFTMKSFGLGEKAVKDYDVHTDDDIHEIIFLGMKLAIEFIQKHYKKK